MSLNKEKVLLVLSSPSGAGKTTLTKKIQEKFPNFKSSVSHTTRKPRENEINKIDYIFVNFDEFEELIKNKSFYEYAKIFSNYYGTSKKSIQNLLDKNYNILFDIDWQGTQQLSKFKELNLIKIFILPPNKAELKKRLIKRNQDNETVVNTRLEAYENDIEHWVDYDHVIINDNLEICFNQIEKIIHDSLNKSKNLN